MSASQPRTPQRRIDGALPRRLSAAETAISMARRRRGRLGSTKHTGGVHGAMRPGTSAVYVVCDDIDRAKRKQRRRRGIRSTDSSRSIVPVSVGAPSESLTMRGEASVRSAGSELAWQATFGLGISRDSGSAGSVGSIFSAGSIASVLSAGGNGHMLGKRAKWREAGTIAGTLVAATLAIVIRRAIE